MYLYDAECRTLHYGNGNFESVIYMDGLVHLTKPKLYALMKNIRSMVAGDEWEDLRGHIRVEKAKEAYERVDNIGKGSAVRFKKARVHTLTKAKEVESYNGYEFTFNGMPLLIYKKRNTWHISCPKTGCAIGCGRTRDEAVKNADERGILKKYAEGMKAGKFDELVDEYAAICAKAGIRAAHETKPRNTALETAKNTENPEDWEGVTVTQKNAKCCIWVSGKTKGHEDALKALGYTLSEKKGAWWKHPEGWAA